MNSRLKSLAQTLSRVPKFFRDHRRTSVHGWREGRAFHLEDNLFDEPKVPPANAPIVAVVDAGFDYKHPEFEGAIALNLREAPGTEDKDKNGYPGDYYGVNVWKGTGDPSQGEHVGHGTWTAGQVAAIGLKVPGIAAGKAKVMLVSGSFTHATELPAFEKAVDYILQRKKAGDDVRVVSASFGETYSASEAPDVKARYTAAVQKLLDADIAFVVAAGNDGRGIDSREVFPARVDLPNVITVAAMDSRNERLASFSNFGEMTVEMAALGERVLGLAPNNKYANMSGTSMATPRIAGALAVLAFKHPEKSAVELVSMLMTLLEKDPDLATKIVTGAKLNEAALP